MSYFPQNVLNYCTMSSLTIECVLLLRNVFVHGGSCKRARRQATEP